MHSFSKSFMPMITLCTRPTPLSTGLCSHTGGVCSIDTCCVLHWRPLRPTRVEALRPAPLPHPLLLSCASLLWIVQLGTRYAVLAPKLDWSDARTAMVAAHSVIFLLPFKPYETQVAPTTSDMLRMWLETELKSDRHCLTLKPTGSLYNDSHKQPQHLRHIGTERDVRSHPI